MTQRLIPNVYFSDFFEVNPSDLYEYGAYNISLINDLPLFIDPFLLFNSEKLEYKQLHDQMINYLIFLRAKSTSGKIERGLLQGWFTFSEVKQNWLGFTIFGNKGRGLGHGFAENLHRNLGTFFSTFGHEKVSSSSHLEKLTLIREGVGRDCISDFTTNLIKEFLLEYTQTFAQKFISPKFRETRMVSKVSFNYRLERWVSKSYDLPIFNKDYVLLTPFDVLSRDDNWINRDDMLGVYKEIVESVSNEQLRAEVDNYLSSVLIKDFSREEEKEIASRLFNRFPQLIDYYIRLKEQDGQQAVSISNEKVIESRAFFYENSVSFINALKSTSQFYEVEGDTLAEARSRIMYMKSVIEDQDGYKIFYHDGQAVKRETDLQLIFKMAWYASPSDFNSEVNNGRGPVDFKISRGSRDKTLVEFKLASNKGLKKNLQNQLAVYEKANNTNKSLTVIVYFSEQEQDRVRNILSDLGLTADNDIILIDARADNKPSGSRTK